MGSNPVTESRFEELGLSQFIKEGLAKLGMDRMTRVQRDAIPLVTEGKNVAAKAPTGSGKTLAFVLPALDLLYRAGMKARNGTGVIVITPTRELALQIYQVARDLAGTFVTVGLAIGGTSRQQETEALAKGVNLLIATPGRLRDHLSGSVGFKTKHLFLLIFDEADHLLDMGFEDEISAILYQLPNKKTRQTCFFSATLSERIFRIRNLDIEMAAVTHVDSCPDPSQRATMHSNFEQGFLVCPPDKRFVMLYTFLKRKANKKIIAFFSSCAETTFYHDLIKHVGFPGVVCLNGQMKQQQRTRVYHEFCNAEMGCLVATNVAARGLDIPDVDYILQVDPPDSVESYVHRAGRACRGSTTRGGIGILFLMPHEQSFVTLLRGSGLQLSEFEFPREKLISVEDEMVAVVSSEYYLKKSAQDAIKSFMQSYALHPLKRIFNINKIDIERLGRSFGLLEVPRIDAPGWKPSVAKRISGRRHPGDDADGDGEREIS